MLRSLRVERFKSLVKLDLDLGRINVFIGANGSGKSNILEALGVLGAAAFGRVDDETLLRRGVRPGVPRLYKTAFELKSNVPHIFFGATDENGASYDVSLWNPLTNPSPAWKFKTENLRIKSGESVVTRALTDRRRYDPEQGLAALHVVDRVKAASARALMERLRAYSIHCPNTPSLRGVVQDLQAREPVGLAGGRLPEAMHELLQAARKDESARVCVIEARNLIDWARAVSVSAAGEVPLSPSAARSQFVIRFVDRFMAEGRNLLTGYDASEGALYILYCAVLALHPKAPRLLAIDNVDQALNPRLATRLMQALCTWTARSDPDRQWLLTAHNPAVLDGLPIDNSGVRLFTVNRDSNGHTVIRAIDLAKAQGLRSNKDWTLSRMWMNGLLGGVPNV
jgi:energy-coupling factor transporter ATP-binding protein EcfA2